MPIHALPALSMPKTSRNNAFPFEKNAPTADLPEQENSTEQLVPNHPTASDEEVFHASDILMKKYNNAYKELAR